MESKTFADTQCPIARAVDSVGEWWSILILREALYGVTRFDEFEKALRIAPTMLTRRLKSLVESGVLERRIYSERPARRERPQRQNRKPGRQAKQAPRQIATANKKAAN